MHQKEVKLYFKRNYDDLVWPDNENCHYLRKYFEPLITNGINPYISNITATPFIIRCEDLLLPGIIPGKLNDCYVSSPYSQYITYAIAELREIDSVFARIILKVFLKFLGALSRGCHINKVVYVNNWLLSTNLYPEIERDSLAAIKSNLQDKYPDRVIVFRSLNEKCNKSLMKDLFSSPYLLPSVWASLLPTITPVGMGGLIPPPLVIGPPSTIPGMIYLALLFIDDHEERMHSLSQTVGDTDAVDCGENII